MIIIIILLLLVILHRFFIMEHFITSDQKDELNKWFDMATQLKTEISCSYTLSILLNKDLFCLLSKYPQSYGCLYSSGKIDLFENKDIIFCK